MNTRLITTVHWNVPDEFKKHIEQNDDLHLLVFGGGSERLKNLNDEWLMKRCVPDDYNKSDNISKLNP